MISNHLAPISISFVVPRYGVEVSGGAENATRLLAQALMRHSNANVEILTTTALALSTWDNHFNEGTETLSGIKTRRFRVDKGRLSNFTEATKRALAHPTSVTEAEAAEIIALQGPVSYGLIKAISESKSDVIAFYPYLYHPTVAGIDAATTKTILHPAAHDEPILDLPIFKRVFENVDGIVFHTHAERAVIETRFAIAQKPSIIFGPGIDNENDAGTTDTNLGPLKLPHEISAVTITDQPFILCLGRVDAPKGTTLLVEMFSAYKLRNPSPLTLVIAGPIEILPNPHPDVLVTGPVSEAVKNDLLNRCITLISPSAFESFSMVLIEAWNKKKPVIVNALCAPTTEQVYRSGGGFVFDGFETFEAALDLIRTDSKLSSTLGRNGFQYARMNYAWENSIPRYINFINQIIN